MSAQANVVINDGQSTPAAHTFVPKGARVMPNGKTIAVWKDQSPVNAEGYLELVESHLDAFAGQKVEKFRWHIVVPTLHTVGTNDAGITPPATRAYSTEVVIEFFVTKHATQDELKNIVAYAKNFLALQYVYDAITKREAAW